MIAFPATAAEDWAAAKAAADDQYDGVQAAAESAALTPRSQRTPAERSALARAAVAHTGREREQVLDLIETMDAEAMDRATPAERVDALLTVHKATRRAFSATAVATSEPDEDHEGLDGHAINTLLLIIESGGRLG